MSLLTTSTRVAPLLERATVSKSDGSALVEVISDLLTHLAVESELATPPTAETGQLFLIASSATGDWTSYDGQIALWDGIKWVILRQTDGSIIYNKDTSHLFSLQGGAWKRMALFSEITGGGGGGGGGPVPASTPTITTKTASNVDQLIISANPDRLGIKIVNDSDKIFYLRAGTGAASSTDWSDQLGPGQTLEDMGTTVYTGAYHGIWGTGVTGKARITEYTA